MRNSRFAFEVSCALLVQCSSICSMQGEMRPGNPWSFIQASYKISPTGGNSKTCMSCFLKWMKQLRHYLTSLPSDSTLHGYNLKTPSRTTSAELDFSRATGAGGGSGVAGVAGVKGVTGVPKVASSWKLPWPWSKEWTTRITIHTLGKHIMALNSINHI